MSNLFKVFVFVALSTNVQGATVSPFDDILEAAKAGQWDTFQKLVFEKFGPDGWKEIKPGSVRDLKPPQGGHVYGESEYTFQSSSDYNGEKSEVTKGHKIINNDGAVKEYDFKPDNTDIKTHLEQTFKPQLFGFKPEDFKTTIFSPDIKTDLTTVNLVPTGFLPNDTQQLSIDHFSALKPPALPFLNSQVNSDVKEHLILNNNDDGDKKARSYWHF